MRAAPSSSSPPAPTWRGTAPTKPRSTGAPSRETSTSPSSAAASLGPCGARLTTLTLLIAAAVGCGSPPDVPDDGSEVWTYWDGYATPFSPYLFELTARPMPGPLRLPTAQLSLVTWPELQEVETTVSPRVIADDDEVVGPRHLSNYIIELVPESPLTDRWYAIRWRGAELPSRVTLDGVPLSDGSVVWRLPGRFFPEVDVVDAELDGGLTEDVVVTFTSEASPTSCAPSDERFIVEQGDVRCAYECPTSSPSYSPAWWVPCPALDRARPFTARLPGGAAVGFGGEAVPGFTLELTLRAEVSRRRPPPVPAELCAGVGCE